MLSVWEILPAHVSLPSLVEVVGLLHNWIRSPSRPTAEWRSSLRVLVCVSVQIWGPGLHFGVLIWVIFWSLFRVPFLGTVLGPYNYKQNPGPQNRAQKWNPKQGPKYDPKQAPKCNPGPQICTERKQGRVEMIFIQRSVCLAILFNCATNQQLQPKKEGKLGRAKLLKQRAWIHSQTKHTLKVLRMGTTFFLLSNPQKLAPLIVTFASTNTPATFIPNQREREKKDVCKIYVYIWVYIDIYACMHKRISIHIYTYIYIYIHRQLFTSEREREIERR